MRERPSTSGKALREKRAQSVIKGVNVIKREIDFKTPLRGGRDLQLQIVPDEFMITSND